MSTDDLREKLAEALAEREWTRDIAMPWTAAASHFRDSALHRAQPRIDALMPVIREALAEAWDDGAQACYEWQVGVTGKPGNPWRGASE